MTDELPSGFPPGTVLLDKYRILRDLGEGGMGVVVCAENLAQGSLVAMKFLLPDLAALPSAAARFLREGSAATRIQSEHIARVFEVGTLPKGSPGEGLPFIVMEYLEGKDLGRILKTGKVFSIHEAIDFIVQAADGLARAHRSGIIHRDVKPANLFLTARPDGTPLVKVLDFGIAKLVEEAAAQNAEITRTTAVMGSALYMSLEQMIPTKTVDQRTDIYALGVSLYELLTRTHPYTADSFSELCVKVSLDPPDPLRSHRADVPEELADVIACAYARSPDDRYPTVGGFAAALAPFAAPSTLPTIEAIQRFESLSTGEIPIVRMPTPLANRAVTVQRPRRIPWAMIGSGVLVAAAVSAAIWFAGRPPGGLQASDAGVPPEIASHTPPPPPTVIPVGTGSARPGASSLGADGSSSGISPLAPGVASAAAPPVRP